MEKAEEKQLKSDKKQTEILIGLALIIMGILIFVIAVYQPRVKTADSESASASLHHSTIDENAVDYETENYTPDKAADENFIVNINTCTAEDLMQIKGIGENKANAIIAYRNVIGSYSSIDEIKNISGFGDKFFESIKDYLTV